MASNYGDCAGCKKPIVNKEHLICSICTSKYDLKCIKMDLKRFNSFYSPGSERKANWKCSECNKQPNVGAEKNLTAKFDSSNVTLRSKPLTTQPDSADTPQRLSNIHHDGPQGMSKQEWTDILQTTISQLVTAQLKNMNEQFSEIRDAMNFYNSQYEDMMAQLEEKTAIIKILQNDNNDLKYTVKDLSNRLNLVEQNMREVNIEINGVPEHRSENLCNTVAQLVKVVNQPIAPEDILHATRVSKLNKDNDRPRAVIAKLRTVQHRDAVLAAVSKYNRANPQDKLGSQHLGLAGPRKPIFVSEHLSPTNKALHAAARAKAKELNYKFIWVRNGRVFVRKDEHSESLLMRNLDSLKLLA